MGIRFESGTTAITVFDEKKMHYAIGSLPEKAHFLRIAANHKSGYLPYLWVLTTWVRRVKPIYRIIDR